MFESIARFCHSRRWLVVAAYGLLLPPALVFGLQVFPLLEAGGFEDTNSESWNVKEELEQYIGVGGGDLIAIYSSPSSTVDDVEVLAAVLTAKGRIEHDKGVVSILSYYETGAQQLVSSDRHKTLLFITLHGDDQEKLETLERIAPALEAPPLKLELGGLVPVTTTLQRTIEADLLRAELIAFPITAFLLLLIFGSVASASLPLALGVAGIALALGSMRLIASVHDVSVFAVNVISILGLGLAIDYSLFLVNRFREELPRRGVEGALVKTISTTGRAVAFSGITVAASLLGLFAFPQMFLRSIAVGGIAIVSLTVIASLTLLPALMSILGERIDAGKLPLPGWLDTDPHHEGFWHRVAYAVMKRPVLVTLVVVVGLLLLGTPFLRFNPSMPDYRVLPRQSAAYLANETLERDFAGRQMTPIDVLVQTEGPALSEQNLKRLHELSRQMEQIDGVAYVSGLFSLAKGVPEEKLHAALSLPPEKQDKQVQAGIDFFASGDRMRFAVFSEHAFNEAPSLRMLDELRALEAPAGMTLRFGGASAFLVELKHTLVERSPIMVGAVCAVMFIVLFLLFGSVTLPIKAMLMNALSLTASFGTIVWIFQDGRFEELLDYTSMGMSELSQPVLMFAVVFGLSMDYEVLLLARVREEYLKTGDNTASVARGLAFTGRLITSAAALLVVVIGAFGTSQIVLMKAIGVGMALAIAIDATIVRALLVPAAMRLMGEWNWYAPAPLVRLWRRAGLSDLEGHDEEEPG